MQLSIFYSLFGEGQSLVGSDQGILGLLGECRWIIPVHLMDDGCSSQPNACLLAGHNIVSSDGASSSRSPVWLGQLVWPHGHTQNCIEQAASVGLMWGGKCLQANLVDCLRWMKGVLPWQGPETCRWAGRWRMLRKHCQSWSLISCLKHSWSLFGALTGSSLDAAVFVQWEGSVKRPVWLGSLNFRNCSVYIFILLAGFK